MRVSSRRHQQEVLRCSFCKKTQDRVAKVISAPRDYDKAYICDECVGVDREAIEQLGTSDAARCSFCHKGRDTVRLFSSPLEPLAAICEECLGVQTDYRTRLGDDVISSSFAMPNILDTATLQMALIGYEAEREKIQAKIAELQAASVAVVAARVCRWPNFRLSAADAA